MLRLWHASWLPARARSATQRQNMARTFPLFRRHHLAGSDDHRMDNQNPPQSLRAHLSWPSLPPRTGRTSRR